MTLTLILALVTFVLLVIVVGLLNRVAQQRRTIEQLESWKGLPPSRYPRSRR